MGGPNFTFSEPSRLEFHFSPNFAPAAGRRDGRARENQASQVAPRRHHEPAVGKVKFERAWLRKSEIRTPHGLVRRSAVRKNQEVRFCNSLSITEVTEAQRITEGLLRVECLAVSWSLLLPRSTSSPCACDATASSPP
jgi:hypothetical protein